MEIKCDNCCIVFNKCKSHVLRAKHNYCSKSCWQSHDKHYNKDFFFKIDSEVKAYWLGFVMADGWLDKRDKCLGLGLQRRDKNHLKKFANIFQVDVKDYQHKKNKHSRCMIYSKTIFCNLQNIGVMPGKSKLDICEVFNHVPNHLIHHFVRGWFDGDGTINRVQHPSPQMAIVGGQLCLGKIRDIIVNAVGCNKVGINKHKNIFSISWSNHNQLIIIRDWLYQDASVFLERKKDKFDKLKPKHKKGSSKFRGVYWNGKRGKWMVLVSKNNKQMYLGGFDNEEKAAIIYDRAIVEFGLPLYKRNFHD